MTTTPQQGGSSQSGWIPEWELSDRLSRTLRETGIEVSGMARQLGVSRETVGRWINGRGKPKRAALLAWASVTGVDLEWLETGEGRPTTSTDPHETLPRLDSNQQPSGYVSAQVRPLERRRRATVTRLDEHRGRAS